VQEQSKPGEKGKSNINLTQDVKAGGRMKGKEGLHVACLLCAQSVGTNTQELTVHISSSPHRCRGGGIYTTQSDDHSDFHGWLC
jgi:hypothetical protein